ncbi:hypothetical protein M5K25_008538 [Dendrobium thyrsiflorum]|uniref:Uncharacterized protein n=1 Tax=Dendrobium thyrsiflorum TaxID=117978 RepID=A0ABD0VFT1_DENTH
MEHVNLGGDSESADESPDAMMADSEENVLSNESEPEVTAQVQLRSDKILPPPPKKGVSDKEKGKEILAFGACGAANDHPCALLLAQWEEVRRKARGEVGDLPNPVFGTFGAANNHLCVLLLARWEEVHRDACGETEVIGAYSQLVGKIKEQDVDKAHA